MNRKQRRAQEKMSKKKSNTEQTPTPAPTKQQSDDMLYRLLDSKIEIPIGALREKHIMVATPCYGGQMGEPFVRSLLKLAILCTKYEIPFSVSTLANESLVTRARNTLTSFFMENKEATHLFFIDADIEFHAEDLLRMVAYDRPVVCGAYPKKAINWDSIIHAARNNPNETAKTIEGHSSNYVVNFDHTLDENGKRTSNVKIVNNLIKLHDAGTGFMCIKKEVIQKMFDSYPELKYSNDLNLDNKFEPFMYALFDTIIDPDTKRYLSEDYTFCRRWQQLGGEIFLDPRTALNHVGHYTFEGNIRKLFSGV